MKRKLPYIFLLFIIFSASPSNAQIIECGTVTVDNPAFYQEFHQKKNKFERSRNIMFFPVKAHIIRNSSGSGGLTITQLNDAITAMNDLYINANMQFFLCDGVSYIDDSNYYNFDSSDEWNMASAYEVSDLINIYFANSVSSNGNALCGYAYYPGGPDRIVMANSCATNGTTLSHEMGHFFYLRHTHGPSNSQLTTEFVNGSNCSNAGDYMCDTPADPMLDYSTVNTSCNYTGNAVDANNDPFEPDPTNIMSYSRKECRDNFTADQYALIEYTATFDRNYFVCNSQVLSTSTLSVSQICPGQNLSVSYLVNTPCNPGNVFTAQLSSSTGGFSNPAIIGSITEINSGTISVVLPSNLLSGNNYRIRVVSTDPPLSGSDNGSSLSVPSTPNVNLNNFADVCMESSIFTLFGGSPSGGTYSGPGVSNNKFNPQLAGTGFHPINYTVANACTTVSASKSIRVESCVGINENALNNRIHLVPNPASNKFSIMAEGLPSENLKMEIINITGVVVFSEFIRNENNEFKKEVSLEGFSSGIYFVKMSNQEMVTVKKLIIK